MSIFLNMYFAIIYFVFSTLMILFFIKYSNVFDNLFKYKGLRYVLDFFLAITFILLIPGMLLIALFYRGSTLLSAIGKNKKSTLKQKIGVPRVLNAGQFKLFLKLSGEANLKSDHQLNILIEKFDQYEFFAISLLFKENNLGDYLISDLRTALSKIGVPVFIPYFNKIADNEELNYSKVLDDFSNTNYSSYVESIEIAGAALSSILKLPLDGENKLVIVNKNSPFEFRCLPIVDLSLKNISIIFDKGTQHQHDITIYQAMVNFLSLIWRDSRLDSYAQLREIAQIRYSVFSKELKDKKEFDTINLLNLMTYRRPGITRFSKNFEGTERMSKREAIRAKIFSSKIEDLLDEHPDFTEPEIMGIKRQEIKSEIGSIISKNIEYSSKVFLNTAILVRDALSEKFLNDNLNTEFDYSGVGISYSKFLEGELNTSLVQLIRFELGVVMPNYFLKYCDKPGNYVIEGRHNFKVDFNKGNKWTGQYYAPGLGQSIISSSIKRADLESKIKSLDDLIKLGHKFKKLRNLSAHPELVNSDILFQMEEIIALMNIKGITDDLIQLREHLKLGN